MSAEEELRLDLDELRRLEGLAKRPRVLSALANEIRTVHAKLAKATSPPAPQAVAAAPTPVAAAAAAPAGVSYVTLGSFSWDQDAEKIKIYVFLEGVEQDKVETTCKPMSVDIKFHDVKDKNYRCAIPKLNKEIVPEKSKVLVKPTKIVVTLYKASKGNWLDLHFKEEKFKPSTDKEKDPMSGIMDLMKNMYEEGDEDMKRTIAKAWSDARSGKAADSRSVNIVGDVKQIEDRCADGLVFLKATSISSGLRGPTSAVTIFNRKLRRNLSPPTNKSKLTFLRHEILSGFKN
uniref:Calcyclin-binding protein n=1 Tax=Leersia perrieri TaxID=77586 RepID=A0A0D9V5U4_9ORYZ